MAVPKYDRMTQIMLDCTEDDGVYKDRRNFDSFGAETTIFNLQIVTKALNKVPWNIANAKLVVNNAEEALDKAHAIAIDSSSEAKSHALPEINRIRERLDTFKSRLNVGELPDAKEVKRYAIKAFVEYNAIAIGTADVEARTSFYREVTSSFEVAVKKTVELARAAGKKVEETAKGISTTVKVIGGVALAAGALYAFSRYQSNKRMVRMLPYASTIPTIVKG